VGCEYGDFNDGYATADTFAVEGGGLDVATCLLLGEIGGPAALTAFWRSTGDAITRFSRL
jgi:hypothetical protein